MNMFSKHFTLEEANACLPWVRDTLYQIHRLIHRLSGLPTYEELLSDINEGPPAVPAQETPTNTPQEEIESLVESLNQQGIVVRDLQRGLIDFPSLRQGEEIFLCYELADGEQIVAWHPLDEGYGGRQLLD